MSLKHLLVQCLCLGAISLNLMGCEREAYVMSNPPVLVAGDEFLDFGELPLGYTATRKLQMVNAGGQDLIIDDYIALSDENVFMATFTKETIPVGHGSSTVQARFNRKNNIQNHYNSFLQQRSQTK